MVRIVEYRPEHKPLWDELVDSSSNGLFMHRRDYMEYHADRFEDRSLLFTQDGHVLAVLPGHVRDGTYFTHEGLSFAGLIVRPRTRTSVTLDLFTALTEYLRTRGARKLVYKPVPHIYHTVPAEVDLYALTLHGARLVRRSISSVVFLHAGLRYSKGRRCDIRKGLRHQLDIRETDDVRSFMDLLRTLLRTRHRGEPTHTAEELMLLAGRFPDNIRLFSAHERGTLVAGVVVYETRHVARAQYIASSDRGRDLAAVNVLIDGLLCDRYRGKRYFDFGTSNDGTGCDVNWSLLFSKEGYGARSIVNDCYELTL